MATAKKQNFDVFEHWFNMGHSRGRTTTGGPRGKQEACGIQIMRPTYQPLAPPLPNWWSSSSQVSLTTLQHI